jgi:hypothetical protein
MYVRLYYVLRMSAFCGNFCYYLAGFDCHHHIDDSYNDEKFIILIVMIINHQTEKFGIIKNHEQTYSIHSVNCDHDHDEHESE